jgi:hypothetical protein
MVRTPWKEALTVALPCFAKMVERLGKAAKLGFRTHPHVVTPYLRICVGEQGHHTRSLQAYLGHRNIQHTVKYTELSPDRFKELLRMRLRLCLSDAASFAVLAEHYRSQARCVAKWPRCQ